jgi:hypothetical protein
MNRPRLFKYLRIAFSAVCLIACVLLIVLWVRSYWSRQWAYVRMLDNYVECSTCRGRFGLQILGEHFRPGERAIKWNAGSKPLAIDSQYTTFTDTPMSGFMTSVRTHRMSGNITLKSWQFVAPCWFMGGLCVAVAGLPWLRWSWRFSLRTLLIATTLVAVLLGLIVYSVR